MEINSASYWNNRFIKDWEMQGGRGQTNYFTNLAWRNLPPKFIETLNNTDNLSILDWGCAEGDGVNCITKMFPQIKVSGLDFSETAIENARKNYPQHTFYDGSLEDYDNKFSIIFTSNTLEHFEDPFRWINQILKYTEQFLIIMVPFQEKERIKEHFFSFDYDSFPLKMDDFVLTYFSVLESDPDYWPGQQLLLMYSSIHSDLVQQFSMEQVVSPNQNDHSANHELVVKLKDELRKRDHIHNALLSENQTYREWLEAAKEETSARDETVALLNTDIKTYKQWLEESQNANINKDQVVASLQAEINTYREWVETLKKEVEYRDLTVENLKETNERLKGWVEQLQIEVTKRDEIVNYFKGRVLSEENFET